MPVSPLSVLSPDALDQFPDLRSVPRHRHFGRHPMIDRLRAAVPFDYIAISGLDVDHYRFGEGFSIDTDMPPAFLETYEAERLQAVDPFVRAARAARDIVAEVGVYAVDPPPARLAYLQDMFSIHNRTVIPVMRGDTVYGAVWVSRGTPFESDELDFLRLVAEAIHTAMTRPLMERFAADAMRLSKGEIACLTLASLGQKSEEIAVNAGYQVDTVNSYLKGAIKKLGAANRTQAIAEAIRRRLIA